MAPLIILIVCFGILFLVNRYGLSNKLTLSFTGRAALAVMLVFTGVAHFIRTEGMIQMLPNIIPLKQETIYLTGAMEIAAAIGLLLNKTAKLTGIVLILFFVAVLPANIVGSMKQVELGGMAQGTSYLYFRIPLQILFIAWTYYFAIKAFD